ncbi:hypothetical protein N7455_008266 [Penicillium solitum]|uniref:uncharacterized protein n=1 Tax=Penicillium solitum TaxID=60172 RepID=UPI0032C4304C|nr:hypothetical protein N7455_008266 [Penicillium solitum]
MRRSRPILSSVYERQNNMRIPARALRKASQVLPSQLSISPSAYGTIARRLLDTSQVDPTPSER